mgnify:CR=1 FL=1
MGFEKTTFLRPVFVRRHKKLAIGYFCAESEAKVKDYYDALQKAGSCLVFQDMMNFKNEGLERRKFLEAISLLKDGDELIIPELSHLGISNKKVLTLLIHLSERKYNIRTLDGFIDTRKFGFLSPSLLGLLLALDNQNNLQSNQLHMSNVVSRPETRSNLGGRPKTNREKELLVIRLRYEGTSYRSIRNQTGLALSTIRRIIMDSQMNK